ncbi:hypothetical protein MAR_035673, partial [Mya arenaria]
MASKQIQCEMCCNENAVGYCKTCGNVGETCINVHKTVKEVFDLLHEDVSIDCEKINTMKSMFNELKAEILFIKDEAEQSKESYKNNIDKCMEECMESGNRIKQRVDQLTRICKDGISEIYEKNVNSYSHITKTRDEKTKWCDNEESKINDVVDNNMAGHFYLVSRHFEKKVSDARSDLKEIKHKHTFKGIDFKENKNLEEVFEQHEDVTGSDDGHANGVVAFITEINKTWRELTALLKNARNELDESENGIKTFLYSNILNPIVL